MHSGQTIFSQLMDLLPLHDFRKCVVRHLDPAKIKKFSCLDQFLALAFAQLTWRESLRDIEVCLRSQQKKLYHMGLRGGIARSTLADANEARPWRIWEDFAHVLIGLTRPLYAGEDLGLDLEQTVYALDATTIDLCLALFPWARFRQTKGAVRLHTLLDLRGNIPSFILITDGKTHELTALDQLVPEPGAIYVMDRAYVDFARLYAMDWGQAFFVIRAKSNFNCRRLYSAQVDKSTGVQCDQTIVLEGFYAAKDYPARLRRIRFYDAEKGRHFVFLSNNFTLPALSICQLYRLRWRVELFFKWIKQHLRVKSFYGTSENAVKTQIWIAISVYVLVALAKKRLGLEQSLYTILQVLSVNLFEKTPIFQLFSAMDYESEEDASCMQLELFSL
jgi:hypothetical protein